MRTGTAQMNLRLFYQANHDFSDNNNMSSERFSFIASVCGAALTGISGWLIENHVLLGSLGIIVGATVGIGGLAVQIWWVRKQHKFLREKHKIEKEIIHKVNLQKHG